MSKAQATKARIIEQAALLFNQQGYAGSSMADLMHMTGLQKGGIYNHFDSKDELAIAAFNFSVARLQKQFIRALKGRHYAAERLLAMLEVYEHLLDDPLTQGGCPILNTAVESDDTHPALKAQAQRAMDSWRTLIHRIVNKGIARGEIPATTEADTVAIMLISTVEGAIMLSKLYDDVSYLKKALGYLKAYVKNQLVIPG